MKRKISILLLAVCLLTETLAGSTAAYANVYSGDYLEAIAAFETPEATDPEGDDEFETETEATEEDSDNKKKGNCDEFIGLSSD